MQTVWQEAIWRHALNSGSEQTAPDRICGQESGTAPGALLYIGMVVAIAEVIIGVTIGLLWGYVRKLDFLFTEIWNIFDNVPQTIVLVLLAYIMKRSMFTLIFAMSITGWLSMALFIRNQVLMIRDRDYNLASRCLGTPIYRIIMKKSARLISFLLSCSVWL